jgi:DNA-directed RNA polymerase specialized sigma24 family protein
VSTLGDEILDFYEPDEDLKLEDIIPDLDAQSPEEEAARSELRQCVDVALAGLPREWRRALLLRYTEGLMGAALATALHRTPAETERILDNARAVLRQHLVESGCRLKKARHGHERHRDDSLPRVRRRQPGAAGQDRAGP